MFFFKHYLHYRIFVVFAGLALLIAGCAQTPNATNTSKNNTDSHTNTSDIFNIDSTVYFENKKSSASLRASFIQNTNTPSSSTPSQQLNGGYQLQFRTILKGNNVIDRASIIAGGQRIILITTPLFIHPQKGLTIRLNEKDTLLIRSQSDATLRFSFNGESHLMSLRNDKLSEFILIK